MTTLFFGTLFVVLCVSLFKQRCEKVFYFSLDSKKETLYFYLASQTNLQQQTSEGNTMSKKNRHNVPVSSPIKLENVTTSAENVDNVTAEPTTEQVKAIEATDNVVKEKETLLAIVTTFSVALSIGKETLLHLVPITPEQTVVTWARWLATFKELFITFLASQVPEARLTGDRITISGERWKPLHEFCAIMGIGYNGSQGSKSMLPKTGETLLPYHVVATFYTWLIKCRTTQVQTVVGEYRLSYDNATFYLTPMGKTFDSLGEYKTLLRMPEKKTEETK